MSTLLENQIRDDAALVNRSNLINNSSKRNIKEEGPVAANCMGDGSKIAGYDPLLQTVKKRLKDKIIKRQLTK